MEEDVMTQHMDTVGEAAYRSAERARMKFGVNVAVIWTYCDPLTGDSCMGSTMVGDEFSLTGALHRVLQGD